MLAAALLAQLALGQLRIEPDKAQHFLAGTGISIAIYATERALGAPKNVAMWTTALGVIAIAAAYEMGGNKDAMDGFATVLPLALVLPLAALTEELLEEP